VEREAQSDNTVVGAGEGVWSGNWGRKLGIGTGLVDNRRANHTWWV